VKGAASALDRGGVAATLGAFVVWGLVPLYWRLLQQVPALQIIAHRVVWSALLVVGWLLLRHGLGWLRAIAARPRALATLALTCVLISGNWGLYIWAVNNGHVVEASLGYFINPLVNVLLGVLVLRERLARLQWFAVATAAAGVAWLTWQAGHAPWIALGLAISFGAYGLLRKLVQVDALPGLGLESLYLLLPALAVVAWGERGHGGHFASGWGLGTDLLLVLAGAVTALPLVGFAYGVRRVPLSLVGLLQYVSPTLQLLLGVLVFGESFGAGRAVGFALIWAALAVSVGDMLWRMRRPA
jgi:chloramphenicol-sensitive protein RarD